MMYKEIILLKYGNVVLTTETYTTNAVEKSTAIFIHSSIEYLILFYLQNKQFHLTVTTSTLTNPCCLL